MFSLLLFQFPQNFCEIVVILSVAYILDDIIISGLNININVNCLFGNDLLYAVMLLQLKHW